MMTPLKIFCLSFICLLAGCATLNSNFECPRKQGVSCKSLCEVNHMVDEGQLGAQPDAKPTQHLIIQSSKSVLLDKNESISRSPENVLAIWLAPFTDTAGRYHTAHTVYSVIHPGSWSAQRKESAYAR